jgi:hypothetical protein
MKLLLMVTGILLSIPACVVAQETTQTHPFLSNRFQLAVGAFARNQDYKLRADGSLPEEEIDFDEVIGVDDDDTSGSFTFRWRYSKNWSFWAQGWEVDSRGGQILTEDIDWEDVTFNEGSYVRGGVENTVVRVYFGRTIHSGEKHEFGLGAGFHWLSLGAFIAGQAEINDEPIGFYADEVSADAPMPNVGGWFLYSPSKRWLIEARADWLDISVGEYSGGIWNSYVGVNFQVARHLGIGLSYQYFKLNAEVDASDWKGGAKLEYSGPFLSLSTNW